MHRSKRSELICKPGQQHARLRGCLNRNKDLKLQAEQSFKYPWNERVVILVQFQHSLILIIIKVHFDPLKNAGFHAPHLNLISECETVYNSFSSHFPLPSFSS